MASIKSKKGNGFTLIELLVSVTIFAIVLGVIGSIFMTGFQSQRRSLAFGTIFDQASFLMEYQSRSLRMARKELAAPACLSQNGLNYELTRSGRGVKFINSQNVCQEFYWDVSTNRLKENKGGAEQYLTASNSEVVAFNINLAGESQTDDRQPRVTFFLNLRNRGSRAESQPSLLIQTSVSQRKLDFQL